MFDCSCLYSDNYVNRKNKMLVKLEKHGVAHVRLKEKEFDGFGIYELCQNIYYIINTYKKACKSIVITCNEFNPTDKLTYILFETILFDLIINRSYDVKFRVKECKTNIMTDGMRDSTLNYHYMYAQNVDKYQKKFKFEQNRIHFRRLFTKEQSEGSGISSLLGELKTFFITSQLGKSNTDQLANVISELVDNVGEHTESDCLVDIDISESPYFKAGEGDVEYLAVNTVVLNFGGKCLCDDMRKKYKIIILKIPIDTIRLNAHIIIISCSLEKNIMRRTFLMWFLFKMKYPEEKGKQRLEEPG